MSSAEAAATPSKALHITLWVLQVLLALAFVGAGVGKATQPIADLAVKMAWVTTVPSALVRFIGISEILGGIGLILPAATRVMPKLTAIAAAALVLVMVLAAAFHVYRGEPQLMPGSVVLGALSAFVAWGRFTKAPILPK